MIGKLLKGTGGATASVAKGLGGALSQSAGVGNFTGGLDKSDLDKSDEVGASRKASDAVRKVYDASSTEVLQRIFSEVKDIHKIIASQIVPASEEKEIARDKKVKDKEVLLALEDLRPAKEKVKKKEPWWKIFIGAAGRLLAWIMPFLKWIINPLKWVKWLLKIPFIASLGLLAVRMAAFFLTPLGLTLLAVGFVAINWKAIKATIKEYVAKIRGWVKTALSFVGLGWMMETEEEKKARLKQEVQAELEAQQERIDEGTAHPSEVVPDVTSFEETTEAEPDDFDKRLVENIKDEAVNPPISLHDKWNAEDAQNIDVRQEWKEIIEPSKGPGTAEEIAAYRAQHGQDIAAYRAQHGQDLMEGDPDETSSVKRKSLKARWLERMEKRKELQAKMRKQIDESGLTVQEIGDEIQPQGLNLHKTVGVHDANMTGVDWATLGGRDEIEGTILDIWNKLNIPKGLKPTFTSGLRPKGHPLFSKGSKHSTGLAFDLRSKNLGTYASDVWDALKSKFSSMGFWGQWETGDVNKENRTGEHFHFQLAGNFQTGGMIPKGKVGLAGEGKGQESVGGQMLEGPTMVSGGEKGTRVKREAPVMYGSAAHKQKMAADPTGGATAAQHQRDMDIAGTSGKAGGIDAIARQRRGALDWADEIGSQRMMAKALIDRRNVTKQAQAAFSIDPTHGQSVGRSDLGGLVKVGWDAEQIEKMIKGRSKGRESEYNEKQVKFYLALAQFGKDFTAFKDINNSRIRELGQLQDAAEVDSTKTFKNDPSNNSALTILNTLRQNLSSQDLTEKIEGSMRMVAAQMQNMPSIPDTTLQQAGQLGSMVIVNNSTVDNSASFSSTQSSNVVGTSQTGIASTDPHAQVIGGISI